MPTPIETQILDYVRTRLRLIKTTNGYDFPVGQNVFMYEVDVAKCITPCCAVVRRGAPLDVESADSAAGVNLQFQVGYVAEYKQDNPHALAGLFHANVIAAIPLLHLFDAERVNGDSGKLSVAFVPSNVGATNITVPVAGRVHGQVDYVASYQIAKVRDAANGDVFLDPRRVP